MRGETANGTNSSLWRSTTRSSIAASAAAAGSASVQIWITWLSGPISVWNDAARKALAMPAAQASARRRSASVIACGSRS